MPNSNLRNGKGILQPKMRAKLQEDREDQKVHYIAYGPTASNDASNHDASET